MRLKNAIKIHDDMLNELQNILDYINKKSDEQIKNGLINCPNCGAPITDIICEYCGTVL